MNAWNVAELPALPGRDTDAILAAARSGDLEALVVGGVELDDLPDPVAARAAVEAAPFVVSLELRESAVTALADVVFPVAPVAEKAGSYLNWEGRLRPFDRAIATTSDSDARVLNELTRAISGRSLDPASPALGPWNGAPIPAPNTEPAPPNPAAGEAVLACWQMLLDAGRLQDGEPHLAGTARPPVARLSAATAAEIGAHDTLTVRTTRGSITLPLLITEMPDRVVWLPTNSPGSHVHTQLGASSGDIVDIAAGSPS